MRNSGCTISSCVSIFEGASPGTTGHARCIFRAPPVYLASMSSASPLEPSGPASKPTTVVVVGGEPRSLVNFRGPLLEALVARGHRVHAFAPGTAPEGLEQMGVIFHPWRIDRTSVGATDNLRGVWALRDDLIEVGPTVLLAYSTKAMVLGCLAARLAGVPRVFAMVTGLGYLFQPASEVGIRARLKQRTASVLGWPWLRMALGSAAGVLVQNGTDEGELRRRRVLPDRVPCVRIAGSGVDLERFTASPAPHAAVVTFLFVGRLLRDKGLREFVDAGARLSLRRPGRFKLVVAGPFDANPSAITKDEVARWVDKGLIEYVGEVSDVRPLLRACSALVLPSYREGLPRSVLEAMAVGRAVITTDAPGCRETVVPGETGLLVRPKDAEALAEAMQALIDAPDRIVTMGSLGRTMAEQRFDVRLVNARILEALGV